MSKKSTAVEYRIYSANLLKFKKEILIYKHPKLDQLELYFQLLGLLYSRGGNILSVYPQKVSRKDCVAIMKAANRALL